MTADLDYAIRNNIAITKDVDLLVNDLSAAIASMERIGMVHNAINPQSIVKQPDGRYVLTSFMSAVRSCETEGFSPMITPYASLEMRQAAASGAIFIPSSADDKFAVAATVADILSNCEWFHTDLNLSEFQDNVYALAKFLLVSPKTKLSNLLFVRY
ncbi:hypothetical protein BKA69DRAFT_214731 [Paraphysoderma sedebokerense]|nr:hypothetical protein BKA69DRAFT_214731 [Paraphysoderma sedebokerense]